MSDRFAILLRHGVYLQKPGTPSALQPFGLTETGQKQVWNAAGDLAGLASSQGWRLAPEIFCSRQLRSWQSATTLGAALSEIVGKAFHITEEEDLAERSVGAFANLTIPEIEQILSDDPRYSVPPEGWKSDSHYKLPAQGAESLLEAGERVADFLKASLEKLRSRTEVNAQIFVGHGAALRHAAHHLGILGFEDIRRFSMHHAKPVVFKLGHDGCWQHHTGDWKERQLLESSLD